MARYITREILCEAYTHLDVDLYDDKAALARLKHSLEPFFQERAKFLLGEDIEVEVLFEDGSLRTRLRVLGSAGLILFATVGDYGSFRQSVSALARDVSSLAESANLEVLFRTKTPYCDRINIEKRRGVFGRVDDLLSRLDSINIAIASGTRPGNDREIQEANAQIDRLVDWADRASNLFKKLEGPETVACIAEGLEHELRHFPAAFSWAKSLDSSGLRGRVARTDPALLGKLQGLATRYSVTLKALTDDMSTRLKHSEAELKRLQSS